MASRKLGVHGKDLPALVPAVAGDAAINTAGMMFLSERGPASVKEVTSAPEWARIFGGYVSGFYGKYSAEGFFQNLQGVDGTLFCRRFVASDATAASATLNNGDAAPSLKLIAGWKGEEDKGIHGKKVLYTITHSNRVSDVLVSDAAIGDTHIHVNAVVDFEIGDYIEIKGGANTETKEITGKDESEGTISFTALTKAFTVVDSTTVKTLNFDLGIYRKNDVGVIELKETWQYLSMSKKVSTYVESVLNNKYRGSEQLIADDQDAALVALHSNLNPVAVATPTALSTGGANGTAPTNSDWNNLCAEFTTKDIRHLCNPESVAKAVNDFGENYCKSIGDRIWYSNFTSNQTYDELLTTAKQYVVSNDSYRMNNAQWLEISNPIGVGEEPTINVPNVGFIMGHAIYWITKNGYQRVPAGIQENIKGVIAVVGDQILDDAKRTKLADAGMNVIQFVPGSGICLRNGRMGSTNKAYKWYNQIFMRMYYKTAFVQSFQELENEETGEALMNKLFNAVRNYLLEDWEGKNTRTGKKCAFLKLQGTKFTDVVKIICDASNNTLDDVLAGNVTIHIYFTPPPPAESIEIGVGISLQIKSAAA